MRTGQLLVCTVALGGCVAGLPEPRAASPGAVRCISGWLTEKGSLPGTYWAVTDAAGVEWRVEESGPADLAAAANSRVTVEAVQLPDGVLKRLRIVSLQRQADACGARGHQATTGATNRPRAKPPSGSRISCGERRLGGSVGSA